MSLNSPRTQVTIMWRARNSASGWPGSKIQVDIRLPPSLFESSARAERPSRRHRRLGAGARGQHLHQLAQHRALVRVDQLAVVGEGGVGLADRQLLVHDIGTD